MFAASSLTPKLFAWIRDHKAIGKDKELGRGEIDVSNDFGTVKIYANMQNSIDLASHPT